jgi:predicted esterase
MTREDRLAEIDDAVHYLDALCARTMDVAAKQPGPAPRVGVLGFSQGATMACRWVIRSEVLRPDRLVLWAGGLPHDGDLAAHAGRLGALDLRYVMGESDEYLTPERLASTQERLEAASIPHTLHRYDGAHRIDRATLEFVITASEQAAS